jgi:hypothetical protein
VKQNAAVARRYARAPRARERGPAADAIADELTKFEQLLASEPELREANPG